MNLHGVYFDSKGLDASNKSSKREGRISIERIYRSRFGFAALWLTGKFRVGSLYSMRLSCCCLISLSMDECTIFSKGFTSARISAQVGSQTLSTMYETNAPA